MHNKHTLSKKEELGSRSIHKRLMNFQSAYEKDMKKAT